MVTSSYIISVSISIDKCELFMKSWEEDVMPGVAGNSGMKPCTLMAVNSSTRRPRTARPCTAALHSAHRPPNDAQHELSYLGWTSPCSCSAAPREAGHGTRCAAGRRRGMPRKEDDGMSYLSRG